MLWNSLSLAVEEVSLLTSAPTFKTRSVTGRRRAPVKAQPPAISKIAVPKPAPA
jgi:hypothetical protein